LYGKAENAGQENAGPKRRVENARLEAVENKKHLKNVGPIRHCEPPHAHSPGVASGTVARRLRIDVHDNDNDDNDNDNACQRGPLWPHGMGPINRPRFSQFTLTHQMPNV